MHNYIHVLKLPFCIPSVWNKYVKNCINSSNRQTIFFIIHQRYIVLPLIGRHWWHLFQIRINTCISRFFRYKYTRAFPETSDWNENKQNTCWVLWTCAYYSELFERTQIVLHALKTYLLWWRTCIHVWMCNNCIGCRFFGNGWVK